MEVDFDERGNIRPYRLIPCTSAEMHRHFVEPFTKYGTRQRLYGGYQRYCTELAVVISTAFSQWVGGSFASAKLNPNDVDVVNLVPFDEAMDAEISNLLPFLLLGGSQEAFNVDGHLLTMYPETDKRFSMITEPVRAYWKNWLSHDRDNHPRGFLELHFDHEKSHETSSRF